MRKAAGIVVCLLIIWNPLIRPQNPTKLIIFPLDAVQVNENLDWLREGIAISISEQIDSPSLKLISRNERIRLVESLDLPPSGRLSRGSMIRIAQQAGIDLVVMGKFSGTEQNLKITLRILDTPKLKFSGEIVANGPLSAMPQMENELAWLIVSNAGLQKAVTRAEFQKRMRRIPNSAFTHYIQSYNSSIKNVQIQSLKMAVEMYRDFPRAQFRLGQLYFSKRDCENALPHLAKAAPEGSARQDSDFMQGTCYLTLDQPERAIQFLSRIPSNARSFDILNNLGVAYIRQGEISLAQNMLLEARKAAPADETVSLNLAIVFLVQGNYSAAQNTIEETIKVHPKDGMLQFIESILLKKEGKVDMSEGFAERAKSQGINTDLLRSQDPKIWAKPKFGPDR